MPFSGAGDGTSPSTAYQITTPAELNEFITHQGGNTVDTYYKLMNDIDCEGVAISTPPTGSLHHIDGQGFTISNMSRVGPAGGNLQGLLGSQLNGGSAKNIILENPYLESSGNLCGLFAGGITDAVVENISIVGGEHVASGDAVGTFTGTVRDAGTNGTIRNCRSTATIRNVATMTTSKMGGFVGNQSYDGGLIDKCYFAGSIIVDAGNAITSLGGFCGNGDAIITNCFYDYEVGINQGGDGNGGTAKTTAQMKSIDTYTDTVNTVGLDSAYDMVAEGSWVAEIWKIINGSQYPILGIESYPPIWQPYRVNGDFLPGVVVQYWGYDNRSTKAGRVLIDEVTADQNGNAPLGQPVPTGKHVEVIATYEVPSTSTPAGFTAGHTYADIPRWIEGYPE